ncbi:MAG: hypothetical protein L7U62_03095 [Candidatus Poseidoniaceae archaeon]|nr:hypothetical protein [Candidatus Poseidoniaceae archaeon]
MSFLASVGFFFFGVSLGTVLPRFPFLLMSRTRGFNTNFPPHPEPVPLSPHLTQRVLHMRMFYWLSFIVVLLPLSLGLASVRWGNAAFGFGLWTSSCWLILNRLQYFVGGMPPPWTTEMAVELQVIADKAELSGGCCNWTSPYWKVTGIYCVNCSARLSPMARPDLGRKRSERRPLGFLRLLLSDGYPIMAANDVDIATEEE